MRPLATTARVLFDANAKGVAPIKSILKPTTSGSRKELNDGFDEQDEASASPSKRRKVFFDDVQNTTYEVGQRKRNDVKKEVRTALEEHLRGNDGPYDILREMFANDRQRYLPPVIEEEEDTLQPHELQVYFVALTSCVSILKSKECGGLVRTLLQSSWLGRDDSFVKIFTHFLAALVSVQGSYLVSVLSHLVEKFRDSQDTSWTVPDFPEISRSMMRERLHSSLQYLMQMFPAAVAVLENMLGAKFPFIEDSLRTHMAYIDNLLRVKEYLPSLRDEVLDLILNHLLKIDSQMQVDLEDLDDDITAAVMCTLRDTQRQVTEWEDIGDDESDDESVDSHDADFDLEAVRIRTIKQSVEKMDAILDTLFAFFTPYFSDPGSDKAFEMFTIILREFDHMVLPTYKSRHTQFLMFHFAQQHERLTDAFCGQLIATAFQNNTPSVMKQSAAAYLASFVARGAHVPRDMVRTIFLLLLHHIEQYRRKYEPICRGPDLQRFHSYYSLLQAVLYIFCFRWRDLVDSMPELVDPEDAASYVGQDLEWIGGSKKDISVQILCRLNPLKICAPVIVEEFARLAHRLNFLYIYPVIESNKRIRLTQFLSSTYATGAALRDAGYEAQEESFHQLDSYFPFDPFQLPVSKRWLDGDYIHYQSIPGLNADEEGDSSDEPVDEGVEEVTEDTVTEGDGEDD